MTDEERQKLIARFRAREVVMWTDIDLAAGEIERLAKELDEARERIRYFDEQQIRFRTDEQHQELCIEAAAKAIFYNQCNIMHDHEKEWRKCHQRLWKESAKFALKAAALAQSDAKRIVELAAETEALRKELAEANRQIGRLRRSLLERLEAADARLTEKLAW